MSLTLQIPCRFGKVLRLPRCFDFPKLIVQLLLGFGRIVPKLVSRLVVHSLCRIPINRWDPQATIVFPVGCLVPVYRTERSAKDDLPVVFRLNLVRVPRVGGFEIVNESFRVQRFNDVCCWLIDL